MSHKDIAELMDHLERKKGDMPYVAVILSPLRVWVKKYAWFAHSSAPAEPKETPEGSDEFFLAVRNPSIKNLTVEFECESKHGRIRFDKSNSSGFIFKEQIGAVPQRAHGPAIPIVRNTRIQIMDIGEPSEVIDVRTQTFEDLRALNTRRMVGEPEIESIVLHFG